MKTRLGKSVARLALLTLLVLTGCGSTDTATPAAPNTPRDPGVLAPHNATPQPANVPSATTHAAQLQTALGQNPPILLITAGLSAEQSQAQSIAVRDQRFTQYVRDTTSKVPLRNEIFGIYPLRDSDKVQAAAGCATSTCYRVEMYNYALNLSTSAVVDLPSQRVLSVSQLANSQPDVPQSLTTIALDIATAAPEVAQALGKQPAATDALMANTKTSLNKTRCERSQHLCVAPTFVVDDQALWAIVDLTDGVLVGVRWTTVGTTGAAVTEKGLANDVITRTYCEKNTALEQAGWRMNYILTSSDGLRISDVTYQGKPIFDSVKLVDWHVSYSAKDNFGYSDAVGCPVFSQAAVIAIAPPRVEELRESGAVVGFALEQDFWSELWPRPCNYYYEQRYEFYTDGRFRPKVASVGRGCGNTGTYRPVTRIALAQATSFSEWSAAGWKPLTTEGWRQQADVPQAANGAQFRIGDSAGGFDIMLSRGQFGDGGRGDNAYIYVTVNHADRDEGEADLITLGGCCNSDYHQGPERFIEPNPEPLANARLVLWYVAQLKNDDTPGKQYCWAESVVESGLYVKKTYPCYSGALFTPVKP